MPENIAVAGAAKSTAGARYQTVSAALPALERAEEPPSLTMGLGDGPVNKATRRSESRRGRIATIRPLRHFVTSRPPRYEVAGVSGTRYQGPSGRVCPTPGFVQSHTPSGKVDWRRAISPSVNVTV